MRGALRSLLLAVSALLALNLTIGQAGMAEAVGKPPQGTGGKPETVDDELLVKFHPGTPKAEQDQAHAQAGAAYSVPNQYSSQWEPDDHYGHGTHVAGTAAAATNNGTGIAGTCPNCDVINGKVMGDDGSGAYDWIANGVLWAVGCDWVV